MPSAQTSNAPAGAKGRKRRRKRKSGNSTGNGNGGTAGSPGKSGRQSSKPRAGGVRRPPRRKKKVRLNPAELQVANEILESNVFGEKQKIESLMHEIVHELGLTYFDDRDVTLVGQIYDALIQKKKQTLLYGGSSMYGREEPETAGQSEDDEGDEEAGASAASTAGRRDNEDTGSEGNPLGEGPMGTEDDAMLAGDKERRSSMVTDPEFGVPSVADDTPIEDDEEDTAGLLIDEEEEGTEDPMALDEDDDAEEEEDEEEDGDEQQPSQKRGLESKSSTGSVTSSKRRRKRKKRRSKKKKKSVSDQPVRPPSSDDPSESDNSVDEEDSAVTSEMELNPIEIVENEIGSFDANDLDRCTALLKKWIGQLTIDESFAEVLIKLKCAESIIQKVLLSQATYVSTDISHFAKQHNIAIISDVNADDSQVSGSNVSAEVGSSSLVMDGPPPSAAASSSSSSASGTGGRSSSKRSKKRSKRGRSDGTRRTNTGAVKERAFRSMLAGLVTVFGYLLQGPREYHEWLIKTIFSLHLSLQSFSQPRQDELRRSFSNDFRKLVASQTVVISSEDPSASKSVADVAADDASSSPSKKKRRRRRSKKKSDDQMDEAKESGKSAGSSSSSSAKIAPTAVCRKIAASVGLDLDSLKAGSVGSSSKRSNGGRRNSKRSSTKDEAEDEIVDGISTTFGTRLVGLEKYGSDLERIMEELLEREREMNKLRPTNNDSFKDAMRRMEETVERKLKKLGREESELKKELGNINEEKKHYKLLIKQRLQPLHHNLDQLKSELNVYLKEKDELESRLIEINNTISEYTIREEEMSNEMERMKSDYIPKETSLNDRYNGLLFESKRKEKESDLYLLMEKIYKLSMEKLDDWSDELVESYQSSSLKLIKEYLSQLFQFLSELNSLKSFINERINLSRKHVGFEKDKHRLLPKYFGSNDALKSLDQMKEKCQSEMNLWNEQIKKDRKIFNMLENEMNYLLRKTQSIIETVTETNGPRIFNDFLVRIHRALGTTGGLPYTVEPTAPRRLHPGSTSAAAVAVADAGSSSAVSGSAVVMGPSSGVTGAGSSSSSSTSSGVAGYYAGHPDPSSYYTSTADHSGHHTGSSSAVGPSAPPFVSMYVPSSHHHHHPHHGQAGAPYAHGPGTSAPPTIQARVFPQTAHRAPPRTVPSSTVGGGGAAPSGSGVSSAAPSSSSGSGITIKDSKPTEPRRRRSGHPPRTSQVYSYQNPVAVAAAPSQRYQ